MEASIAPFFTSVFRNRFSEEKKHPLKSRRRLSRLSILGYIHHVYNCRKTKLLLMEEILHHLGCIKPSKVSCLEDYFPFEMDPFQGTC